VAFSKGRIPLVKYGYRQLCAFIHIASIYIPQENIIRFEKKRRNGIRPISLGRYDNYRGYIFEYDVSTGDAQEVNDAGQ
jgi:hypothetical protein